MISYAPLWKTMEEKSITKYALREKYKVSSNTISRMQKGRDVSTRTLNEFCLILHCNISDIVDYVEDEAEQEEWLAQQEERMNSVWQ